MALSFVSAEKEVLIFFFFPHRIFRFLEFGRAPSYKEGVPWVGAKLGLLYCEFRYIAFGDFIPYNCLFFLSFCCSRSFTLVSFLEKGCDNLPAKRKACHDRYCFMFVLRVFCCPASYLLFSIVFI